MAGKIAPTIDSVLNLYKRQSETPLQTIERYVAMHREYKGVKMTYAGRLDPMAEGVLIVLSGEKNKERETYTGLDKDYEFEFMLGVQTDTFDVLGKVTGSKTVQDLKNIDEKLVKKTLEKYTGTFDQKYPPYSSKVINGVQMFELARTGKLLEKDIPSHSVTASKIELVSSRNVPKDDFVECVCKSISDVGGDFRQKDILDIWTEYFDKAPTEFTIYKAHVSCGSGFYVRQLISDLGRDLGVGAVTTSILRTRVGEFKLADSIK